MVFLTDLFDKTLHLFWGQEQGQMKKRKEKELHTLETFVAV